MELDRNGRCCRVTNHVHRGYPNIRSAAAFQLVITPSGVLRVASNDEPATAKCAAISYARLRSLAAWRARYAEAARVADDGHRSRTGMGPSRFGSGTRPQCVTDGVYRWPHETHHPRSRSSRTRSTTHHCAIVAVRRPPPTVEQISASLDSTLAVGFPMFPCTQTASRVAG